jgi:hypothetical protein
LTFIDLVLSALSVSHIRRVCSPCGAREKYAITKEGLSEIGLKPCKTLSKTLDSVLAWLVANYPCEIVYKQAIAKQIVVEKLGIANAAFINEPRIFPSIADCVIAAETAEVFEIKTEFDSPSRLTK